MLRLNSKLLGGRPAASSPSPATEEKQDVLV
jgi:hypothetical protein